jgi:ABC-2 type transport system ATP-binding protein
MLEVVDLSKSFGKVQAVKNFSFRVPSGEVVGLIGPNGSGKTTILRCVCSILRPDSGMIRISGHDLNTDPVQAKSSLAYVPEIPNPYMHLTVNEHIEFTARLFELTDWEVRAHRMVENFDLAEKKDELIKTLSKGQKQKVNIICAFLHNPKVILLDEPLYGIDPKGGKHLKDLVREARGRGASIVISSHMLGLVQELGTKYVIIWKGEKLADGTFEDITKAANLQMGSKLEDVYIEITEAKEKKKESAKDEPKKRIKIPLRSRQKNI